MGRSPFSVVTVAGLVAFASFVAALGACAASSTSADPVATEPDGATRAEDDKSVLPEARDASKDSTTTKPKSDSGPTSSDASTNDGADSAMCGLLDSFAVGVCDDCISANCCDLLNTCYLEYGGGMGDCRFLYDCMWTCSSLADDPAACKADCRALYPAELAQYDGLVSCVSTNCKSCPVP